MGCEVEISEEKLVPVPVPNFEDRRDGYKFSHVQVPHETVFQSNFHFTAYQKFAKEHNDSMGFDVENYFPKKVGKLLSVRPVILSPSKILFEACKTALQTVLDYLDTNNEHSLLFIRIVKANYRSDSLFFVTFDAITKDEGLIEEYQSVIFRQLDHDKVVLHMFRKKGAVKGAVQYDCRDKYHFDTIGGAKESDFKSNEDFIAYQLYAKEHDDSQGFDIKHFPRQLGALSMILKPLCKTNKSLFEDCKIAVQNVLEYLKTKNEHNLKLISIVKANYLSDFRFFVTFEVKSFRKSRMEEYQAVLDRHRMHGKITLHMFRKTGEIKGAVKGDWRDGGYRFCSIGGLEERDFDSKEHFIAYQRYAKEHDDSEGFDIEHFIPPLSGGLLTILKPLDMSYTSLLKSCGTAVRNVLEYLTRKDEISLEFVKVIKANYSASYLFYVTFEAKLKDTEEIEEYQSVIYHNRVYRESCLQMFRKKGEKLKEEAVHQAFDDERYEYEFDEVRNYNFEAFEKWDDYFYYEKYVKEHNESEGFDIETFVGPDDGDASLTLLPVQISDNIQFRRCKKAVEIVLHHLYSMNEENLELVRVVKANYREPYLYFITLKAKDKDSGKINAYQSVIYHNGCETELNLFRKKRKRNGKRNADKLALEGQRQILEPGMVLLKGYLSVDDQVKIVKKCRQLGLRIGGFYQPGYRDVAKLNLKMMFLGKNWDPNTSQYGEIRPNDGEKPPIIPDEFRLLVERALKDSRALVEKNSNGINVEKNSPDICIVNFYSASGRLGLHQDKDESEGSLKKGLPVVSFSIGGTGEFLYGDSRDEKNAKKVLLKSGDVLIFGGKSRQIFHGVRSVDPKTAPQSLLHKTNLLPGQLNLTFRHY